MDRKRGALGAATAAAATAAEDGDRGRKRRKQSTDAAAPRSQGDPRTVFDAVWGYQERNRNIRQHFEQLPSRLLYPDYYSKIVKPISLREIKAKLDRNEYAGINDIKKDILLMCDNAAQFNKAKSQVHSDSLRLRKLVDGFEDPPKAGTKGGKGNSPAAQQAMVKLIDDCLSLTNESGELVSQYFKNLPSKKLYGDYYRLIARPISLTQIRTRAKEGKYREWSEFEGDVLLIRKNAEEYNAEGSDIVKDAREQEAYFLKRLEEEKSKIVDPPPQSSGIKLRLNLPAQAPQLAQSSPPVPKIKLNVGSKQQPPSTPQTSGSAPSKTQPTPQPVTNGVPRGAAAAAAPTPALAAKPVPSNAPATPAPGSAASKVVAPPTVPTRIPAHSPALPIRPPAPAATPVPAHAPPARSAQTPVMHPSAQRPPPPPHAVQMSPTPQNNYVPPGHMAGPTGHQMIPPPNMVVPSTPLHSQQRTRSDTRMTNGSHSPPPGSIVVGSRSSTPRSQAAMSPPAGYMPPPGQRMSATPRPPSFSPAPNPPRMLHMGPTSVPQGYQQPIQAPQHQAPQHQEPIFRAEGQDKSSALISNCRVTVSAPMNPNAEDIVRELEPDDRKVTAQYYLHVPSEYQVVSLMPTLASTLTRRPLYIVRAAHWSGDIRSLKHLSPDARGGRANQPVYSVRLNPGIVNVIEVTAVTQSQRNGVNGANNNLTGIERWEMERFRVFISPQ